MATVDVPAFLRRVLPWPSPQVPEGMVTVHWSTVDSKGRPIGGKAVQRLDDFLSLVQWATIGLGQRFIRDLYFCTALQEKAGPTINGKIRVLRNAANSAYQKSIFADIDIKPGTYPTVEVAIIGLEAFIKAAGLPPPTALVHSGGGLHVYWISDRPFTIVEWLPYAHGLRALAEKHGLKCDLGVTIDCCRILRIPGTFNYKQAEPRPVRLLRLSDLDIDFEKDLAFIKVAAGGVNVHAPRQQQNLIMFEVPRGLPPITNQEYIRSIETCFPDYDLLDPRPIFMHCPMFRAALAKGGRFHAQPQWHLAALACTFVADGRKVFHEISKGHATYTPESCDEMFDRKETDQQERSLGWPACKTFDGNGAVECKTCIHRGSIQSPLNLSVLYPFERPGEVQQIPGAAQQLIPFKHPTAGPSPPELNLPKDYFIGPRGYISKVITTTTAKGDKLQATEDLLLCKVSNPWLEVERGLHFTISTDKGHTAEVVVPRSALGGHAATLSTFVSKQQAILSPKTQKEFQDFMSQWYSEWQKALDSINAVAFGWMYDAETKTPWFAYGGKLYGPNGQERPAGSTDQKLIARYTPCGDLQPWLDALSLVTKQNRPGLEAIVAASFGAPLVWLAGEFAAALIAIGDAGANKSTAVHVALSVWGHPKQTKQTSTSSEKAGAAHTGSIHHLPAIWDDISDPANMDKFIKVTKDNTDGVAGAKLLVDRSAAGRDEWCTIVMGTSNKSVFDRIVHKVKDNTGNICRIFEFNVGTLEDEGRIKSHLAPLLISALEYNYGEIGCRYAYLLGSSADDIRKMVKDEEGKIAEEVKQTDMERFWRVLCAATVVGARLANSIGCNFHSETIRAFMIEQYFVNRSRITEEALGSTADNAEEAFQQFYKSCTDNILRTDIRAGVGRYQKVQMLSGPRFGNKEIHVHWVVKERLLRFSRAQFHSWLMEHNYTPSVVVKGMKARYPDMHLVKVVPGAGLDLNTPQERMYSLAVPPGTWLEQEMDAGTPPLIDKAVLTEAATRSGQSTAAGNALPPAETPPG